VPEGVGVGERVALVEVQDPVGADHLDVVVRAEERVDAFEIVGGEGVVRVGEGDPLARRGCEASSPRDALPCVRLCDDRDVPGVAGLEVSEDAGCLVGRSVVDEDHFDAVEPEGLGLERRDEVGEVPRHVVDSGHDREAGVGQHGPSIGGEVLREGGRGTLLATVGGRTCRSRRMAMVAASPLRRLGARIRGGALRLARVRAGSPLLTVVVPFYNVQEFLAEAVGSLRAQTYENLEVLLVDDGSTDGSLALARTLTADDPRFTVLEVPHGGQGTARNHALARSQGEYVTFMDADDVVPSDAYAAMVGSLEASGSDMALGNVERFDSERAWVPGWARAVHRADVRGTTLADMPEAMRDILACNRVYRRSFWDERVREFPEGMVFEDHVPMLRALLGGSRFDVLAQVTYRWRRREDRGSSSQPKDELANLADRARAKAEAWNVLEAEGTEEEQGLWLARARPRPLALPGPRWYGVRRVPGPPRHDRIAVPRAGWRVGVLPAPLERTRARPSAPCPLVCGAPRLAGGGRRGPPAPAGHRGGEAERAGMRRTATGRRSPL